MSSPIPFPDNGAVTPIDMTDNEGLWHFDSAATDTSGVGNNATLSGTTYVAGKIGTHAVNFSSGDYVEVPDDPTLQTLIGTVSFWMKTSTSTAGSNASLIGKHDSFSSVLGWHVYLDNNQIAAQIKSLFASPTNLGAAGPALNDNAWHHIVFVFVSGGTSKLFVDGVQVAINASTLTMTVGNKALRMAVSLDSYWGSYVGSMDEVAIWSRALSDAEVANIYSLQSGAATGGSPTSQGSDLQGEELQGAKLQGDT